MDGDRATLEFRFSERFGWCSVVDLLGVAGMDGMALSSLLGGRLRSPDEGCAMVVGREASESDRDLGECGIYSRCDEKGSA